MMRGGNRVTHREISPVAKGQASHQRKNSPVVKARRATKDTARRPKNTDRPRAKPAKCDRQRRTKVLTIIKRGVEGGETVDSDWLQQTVRKIGVVVRC